jgi:hypothetical protein
MPETPKTQGWVEDASAYRLVDYAGAENPASVAVKQTPLFKRVKK